MSKLFLKEYSISLPWLNSMQTVSLFCYFSALVFFFLGSSNIFSLQGYLILIGTFFLFFSVVFSGKISFSWGFFAILIFGFSYNFGMYLFHLWSVRIAAYFLFIPAIFYLFARGESVSPCLRGRKRVSAVAVSILLGMLFSGLLTVTATTFYGGYSLGQGQPLHTFWSNGALSRTSLSLYLVIPSSLCFFGLSYSFYNKKTLLALFSLSVIAFMIVVLSLVGNRAPIISFGMMFLFSLDAYFVAKKKKALYILAFVITGFVFLGGFLLIAGFVPDFLKNIPAFSRFANGGSNHARAKLYVEFFQNAFRFPLGGLFTKLSDKYVHNFWLDIYSFGGFVPFVTFTACMFFLVVKRAKFHFKFDNALSTHSLLIFVWIATISIGIFEPLYQANELLFAFFGITLGFLEPNGAPDSDLFAF